MGVMIMIEPARSTYLFTLNGKDIRYGIIDVYDNMPILPEPHKSGVKRTIQALKNHNSKVDRYFINDFIVIYDIISREDDPDYKNIDRSKLIKAFERTVKDKMILVSTLYYKNYPGLKLMTGRMGENFHDGDFEILNGYKNMVRMISYTDKILIHFYGNSIAKHFERTMMTIDKFKSEVVNYPLSGFPSMYEYFDNGVSVLYTSGNMETIASSLEVYYLRATRIARFVTFIENENRSVDGYIIIHLGELKESKNIDSIVSVVVSLCEYIPNRLIFIDRHVYTTENKTALAVVKKLITCGKFIEFANDGSSDVLHLYKNSTSTKIIGEFEIFEGIGDKK